MIIIKENKEPPFNLLYNLLKKELRVLREDRFIIL